MTILGDAVFNELEKRHVGITHDQVEKILLDAGVSSTPSRGVPARLRVRHLHVTGTKRYAESPGNDTKQGNLKCVPINLNWAPNDGVNGVGSESNLRGKSSVLHLIMWALTGRSHLQADVASWIDHVSAEFHVDDVPLYVDFDVHEGIPAGTIKQRTSSGGHVVLNTFNGHSEFESVMGTVMLERLRLDVISVFSNGLQTKHLWPSYAAALTVHADKLDPIIGNENTLKTRILQMFIGTSWAAVNAQVTAAHNSLKYYHEIEKEQRKAASLASDAALKQAKERVVSIKEKLESYDKDKPDVHDILALTSTVSKYAQECNNLEIKIMAVETAATRAQAELHAEKQKRQAALEDAVARQLFNGMTPTICPRCYAKVDNSRYAAESTNHECSLCSQDFDLNCEQVDVSAGEFVADSGYAATEIEKVADSLDALDKAVIDAQDGVDTLKKRHEVAKAKLREAEEAVEQGQIKLDSARNRRQAELELAWAQGVYDTLSRAMMEREITIDGHDLGVLDTALKLIKQWIKDEQDPLLQSVSETITFLAQKFGSTNITAVNFRGNGNMAITKGGTDTTYSKLTNGEKLRIKLAAMIALIKLGHDDGVGRYPGLLFIDSPGAEEIPEDDLKIMIEAMTMIAEETDLQIIIATTHGSMLTSVLPQTNLLVATGNDFVW